MSRRRTRFLVLLLAACAGLARAQAPVPAAAPDASPAPAAMAFDPEHTRFGFQLRTRWGQRLRGTFPRYQGRIETLPDGRLQVRIALEAAAIDVQNSPRFSAVARGEKFFDAQRWPTVEFVSVPFDDTLLKQGGRLRGTLYLRGRRRVEAFVIEPAQCARPGHDCDVVGRGLISRSVYGLDGWSLALTDRVRLDLRVRVGETR